MGQTNRDQAVVWAASTTGGILAAAAVFWVLRKALDEYVPYQVRTAACAMRRGVPGLPAADGRPYTRSDPTPGSCMCMCAVPLPARNLHWLASKRPGRLLAAAQE
jgi:hypothetical protein